MENISVIVLAASAKTPKREGSILPSSFYGQLHNYEAHLLALFILKFSFLMLLKEMSPRFHLERVQDSLV